MNEQINKAFMQLSKRAETNERATLVKTFVEVGPLFTILASSDHQVIYGRRGTGKTHALLYLAEARAEKGDLSIYVDMRNLGSTGGLYSDSNIPVTERATRLLMDALSAVHEGLLNLSIEESDSLNLSVWGLC